MKLFTVGPVEMYDRTLKIRNQQIPYFRTTEFSNVMFEIEERLKRIIGAKDDSKFVPITGSGSASMEAVVSNAFDSTDKILVINGGSFGARFKLLCEIYNIDHDELKLSFNEELTKEKLFSIDGEKYTALLVNIDETSTGQLYDIDLLSNFCKQYNIRLIVDAISSFLSDPYDMDKYGIDCTIISSQKALSLAPGLSMIVMTNSFYEEKVKNKPRKNLYLNLNEHIKNMERGQTPNTPAVGVCLELLDMLRYVEKIGKENFINETRKRAEYFRSEVMKLGIEIPKYPLSNTLTPIIFKDNNAKEAFNYLKDNYDLYITPNGGEYANQIARVGHIGNLKIEDYDYLIEKLGEFLK